ncbi:MAG: DUF3515 domain-containing protein [Mycobacterium sp.]
MSDPERDGPPRAVLIAALLIAVAAAVTVVAIAAHRSSSPPVPVAAVRAPHAAEQPCQDLLAALPDRLGDYQRTDVAFPAPPGVAVWRTGTGAEPVILRCGLDRPDDFVVGSPLQMVDQVAWFRVAESDRITWFAVDRPVYVALTLPADSGPAAIQDLSQAVAALPARPIDPAPPR